MIATTIFWSLLRKVFKYWSKMRKAKKTNNHQITHELYHSIDDDVPSLVMGHMGGTDKGFESNTDSDSERDHMQPNTEDYSPTH
jgi:hypothetical protein